MEEIILVQILQTEEVQHKVKVAVTTTEDQVPQLQTEVTTMPIATLHDPILLAAHPVQ